MHRHEDADLSPRSERVGRVPTQGGEGGVDEAPHGTAGGFFFWSYLALILATFVAAFMYLATLVFTEPERGLEISFHLIGVQDFYWLAACCLAYPAIWWAAQRYQIPTPTVMSAKSVAGLASLVFLTIWIGGRAVYHGFALSMDEFMMVWQSRLLTAGYLLAPVPEGWLGLSAATRPGFLIVHYAHELWSPGYRPGTAFLHAGFSVLKLAPVMGALFCTASVFVLWRLALRLLTVRDGAVACAVLIFAISPQFIITGMTPYTMTAHLLATLVWIWLFTADRPLAHIAAIALGCYALGLHHVHVHSFMALPFLLHLGIGRRRWLLALGYGAAYAVAAIGWIFWIDIAMWIQGVEAPIADAPAAAVNGDLGFVAMAVSNGIEKHGAVDLLHWAGNLSRLIAWQNLALLPLLAVALWHVRSMPITLRLLVWSIASSLVPYILLMPSQGHGWGYRYLHQCLGHFALLAGFGWSMVGNDGLVRLRKFTTALVIVTLVFGLPYYAIRTEYIVRPFAQTMQALRDRDADIVLIATENIWYGRDLVRNDPLLRNRPIILSLEHVDPTSLKMLCEQRVVAYVYDAELMKTGMKRAVDNDGTRVERNERNLNKLEEAGCETQS